jgi:hypothetical protein
VSQSHFSYAIQSAGTAVTASIAATAGATSPGTTVDADVMLFFISRP